jgi:hypothetical protein
MIMLFFLLVWLLCGIAKDKGKDTRRSKAMVDIQLPAQVFDHELGVYTSRFQLSRVFLLLVADELPQSPDFLWDSKIAR